MQRLMAARAAACSATICELIGPSACASYLTYLTCTLPVWDQRLHDCTTAKLPEHKSPASDLSPVKADCDDHAATSPRISASAASPTERRAYHSPTFTQGHHLVRGESDAQSVTPRTSDNFKASFHSVHQCTRWQPFDLDHDHRCAVTSLLRPIIASLPRSENRLPKDSRPPISHSWSSGKSV